jgi:site-specific DNA-adenine methylase
LKAEVVFAPFPYFGGKRTVASEIWERLGDVTNYVEPFFGSGAVLLARPHAPKTETVNDVDHFLVNFWRAVKNDPKTVAEWADYPISEADLHSRHYWLITQGRERIAACATCPDHFDAKVAGWWLWGACAWIGGGWCSGDGPWVAAEGEWQNVRQMPQRGDDGWGITRPIPHLGSAGQGINRKLPELGASRGINRKLPELGADRRFDFILEWLTQLANRLRDTRVTCGDWSRVCGDSVTWRHGPTGVFLDPPYGVADRATVYSNDCRDVAALARAWAIEAGQREDMRIAFAGYSDEHDFPGWNKIHWKAQGGYSSQGDKQGRINAGRETLWFSPACLSAREPELFDRIPA